MSITSFLMEHRIWIDFFIAVGTVGATLTAVVLALRDARREKQQILSGLAIESIDHNGTGYLANRASRELRFSIYKNEDIVNPSEEIVDYRNRLERSTLAAASWNPVRESMVLSPGERMPLHLKNLVVEETFVALVGVKVVLESRVRYWAFRYAGDKALQSPQLAGVTHPQRTWVLESSFID